jgi:hypothetical protein
MDNRKNILIKEINKNILDFSVKYELIRTTKNNVLSYDLKLTKYSGNKIIENAEVIGFEWREEIARNALEALARNDVTPMCLESCILEII